MERNEQLQAAVHLIRKPKFMSGELPIPLYISSETIKYEWLNCRPGKHLVREISRAGLLLWASLGQLQILAWKD